MTRLLHDYDKITTQFNEAFGANQFDAALGLAQEMTSRYPDSPTAWLNLSLSLKHNLRPLDALDAIKSSPSWSIEPTTELHIADLHIMMGSPEKAFDALISAKNMVKPNDPAIIKISEKLIEINKPRDAEISITGSLQHHVNVENTMILFRSLINQRRSRDAHTFIKKQIVRASKTKPQPQIFYLLSIAEQLSQPQFGDMRKFCIDQCAEFLKNRPDLVARNAHLALIQHRHEEALEKFLLLIRTSRPTPEIFYRLNQSLVQTNQLQRAKKWITRASRMFPKDHRNLELLSNIHEKQNQPKLAVDALRRARQIEPSNIEILWRLLLLARNHRIVDDEFISCCKSLVKLQPHIPTRKELLVLVGLESCDWSDIDTWKTWLPELGFQSASQPWSYLLIEDHPLRQQKRSELKAKSILLRSRDNYQTSLKKPNTNKINLGYLSADFYDHATMVCMAGLFRHHDRDKFNIVLISFGKAKTEKYSSVLKSHGDQFIDISNEKTADAIKLIQNLDLDIAIELKGYTRHNRIHYHAHRLAKLHISFLGYPGTLGSSNFDYMIADQTVIPKEHRDAYSESIIFMPDTYYPTDNQCSTGEGAVTKADENLPSDTVVLCCFSHSLKIQQAEFKLWMEILRQHDDTVLWLIESNAVATANLKAYAEKLSVDPSRLIFAKKLSHKPHLDRLKLADLCIDTFFCNGHTTISDALWVDVPCVTKIGKQLAARVGASLLNAAGLTELITHTEKEYLSVISNLVAEPQKLKEKKKKLIMNKTHYPIFNTEKFTRNFENGLELALKDFNQRKTFKDIYIKE